MVCSCSNPSSSNSVPGGTGDWSFRMNSSSFDCLCQFSGFNRQAVPWLSPGEWHFSGWIKGVGPDGLDGTRAHVIEGLDAVSPTILGSLSTMDSVWAFRQQTIDVPVGVDPDSLFVVFLADGLIGGAVRPVYFDDIQLSQNINTGVNDTNELKHPAFRPNPAVDKLWVDLPEAPITVTAIDAIGRISPLRTFHHNGHTLEVDVSSVLPGPCVLVVNTSSGNRTVRFMKILTP